jgi:hypothetical protein
LRNGGLELQQPERLSRGEQSSRQALQALRERVLGLLAQQRQQQGQQLGLLWLGSCSNPTPQRLKRKRECLTL